MKRLRFALPVLAVLAFVIATGIPAPSRATSTLVPTFATWSTGTTGTLGAATISVSSVGSTIIQSLDFDLSDFDPQGPNSLDTLNYAADSSFEVTFDVPVTNLAIYYRYMRGTTDGFTSFQMNAGAASGTWSVLSGLSGASMVCNYYLDISSTTNAYLDGIVKFTGTLTSIHFASIGGTNSSLQALTFATLEEPPAPTTSTTLAQTTTTTMSTERQTPSFAC